MVEVLKVHKNPSVSFFIHISHSFSSHCKNFHITSDEIDNLLNVFIETFPSFLFTADMSTTSDARCLKLGCFAVYAVCAVLVLLLPDLMRKFH